MIESWLDFPFWLGAPATLIVWLTTAATLWWFFQRSRLAPFWRDNLGVVAPYFSSVAILFSLSVGFMGADIWQRAEQAQQSVLQEASDLKLLSHLAEILEPTTQPLAERICTYAKAVVQQEWPTMLLDGEASPTAETALNNPERTREIGIRLAIGALEREVLLQFLIEAVALSSLGGVVGITLATLASLGLAKVMQVPYVFDPGINLLSFLFSAAIGVIFGYFPARRAARLDPVDALRHE